MCQTCDNIFCGDTLRGESPALREITKLVDTVAQSDCAVLIEGETGTGKELVARRLHAASPRRDKPFVPVNCAGLTESLFESQFFGHVRGAFTGAEEAMLGMVRTADGGTLFVDEISEIAPNLQAKFLRVLQEREVTPVGLPTPVRVDTRFIAATNRNLLEEVRQDRFRRDLFYRLNVVRIHIPPLRDRPEDIPVLLEFFVARYAERHHRPAVAVSTPVRRQLTAHPWPGNVRELMNWVERLYVTGLPPEALATSLLAENEEAPLERPSGVMSLAQAEEWAIRRAMDAADNSQQGAADLLRIHRSTLSRKLKQYAMA